ncbi:hypothetical protein KCU73_g9902, partial [Aureobasidium melanogenum]
MSDASSHPADDTTEPTAFRSSTSCFSGKKVGCDVSNSHTPVHHSHSKSESQDLYEADLLNGSPTSTLGGSAYSVSPVNDQPLSKRPRTTRFGKLDYADAPDLSESDYEEANASDSDSDTMPDAQLDSESDVSNAAIPESYPASLTDLLQMRNRRLKPKIKCSFCDRVFTTCHALQEHLVMIDAIQIFPLVHVWILCSADWHLLQRTSYHSQLLLQVVWNASVPTCAEVFDADATLANLWSHCADDAYEHALYEEGYHRCEMECERGFTDTLARLCHYSKFDFSVKFRDLQHCPKPHCGWRLRSGENKRNPLDTRIHTHWRNFHAEAAYEDPKIFAKDEVCQLSFRDYYSMLYHQFGSDADNKVIVFV